MRISLNWLKELVDFTLSPEELAQTLTIAGFEVEEIVDRTQNAKGVVIGYVLQREKHPDADKLSVCQVDIGVENPLNIVCGASNVRQGIYVAVATIGTYLPAIDLKIKKSKLRGVPSEGMICSLSELGLEKDSEGIHIFSQSDLKPGQDVRPLLGLDDIILDLTATANRADALSMVGVAREVSALTGGQLKLPTLPNIKITENSQTIQLEITEENACPAYIATVLENVKIAPSPDWLKFRLQSAGIRPINNVVDITNYILIEWGQPLHAFDREKLYQHCGNNPLTLGVRFAKSEETLITLDSNKRNLTPQNLVITGNNSPIALAGVMGGEESEVDAKTQNIILETALFNPVTIRRSARDQGLRSESSTRYERGINQAEFTVACSHAIALLTSIAGATPVAQIIFDSRNAENNWTRQVPLRLSRIHEILGKVHKDGEIINIPIQDIERILNDLGCELTHIQEGVWNVTIPPYRYRDLEREIDLIEEVARLYGYDNFLDTLPSKTSAGYLSVEEQTRRNLRQAFRGIGLTELMHYSLVKPTEQEIALANPLFVEYSGLRSNLIDGLVTAFSYNLSQGNGALNGFEIGRIFWKDGENMLEDDVIGGILGGDVYSSGNWVNSGKGTPMTWYMAKGYLESVFQQLGITVNYQSYQDDVRLHPGRTALLLLGEEKLGIFGQLHPQVCQEKDLPNEVYVFELKFAVLLQALNCDETITPRFKVYSTYPASTRDLAFFAPLDVPVSSLEKVMRNAGGILLNELEVFDQYLGQNVPEGQRSLAFNLVYRSSDKTLTDEDVEPVHQKVRDTLVKEFKVILRS